MVFGQIAECGSYEENFLKKTVQEFMEAMKVNEIMKNKPSKSRRHSYQVVVTFDLTGADPNRYADVDRDLEGEIGLERQILRSDEDGGGIEDLPQNTYAVLWHKDEAPEEVRDYIEEKVRKILGRHGVRGPLLVVVADNWAVGAGRA